MIPEFISLEEENLIEFESKIWQHKLIVFFSCIIKLKQFVSTFDNVFVRGLISRSHCNKKHV